MTHPIPTYPEAIADSPRIIPRSEHHVSRANISRNALKVLYRLKDGGYQGFIVGGGVRDLLLNRQPRDFDIATDASPEQVRALFGNARLIGRRFRLVHVRFRDEIVEVATFRGRVTRTSRARNGGLAPLAGSSRTTPSVPRRGRLAPRLHVNASTTNIADFSIWDLWMACAISKRAPSPHRRSGTRYREDTCEMIRAVRLAAK